MTKEEIKNYTKKNIMCIMDGPIWIQQNRNVTELSNIQYVIIAANATCRSVLYTATILYRQHVR